MIFFSFINAAEFCGVLEVDKNDNTIFSIFLQFAFFLCLYESVFITTLVFVPTLLELLNYLNVNQGFITSMRQFFLALKTSKHSKSCRFYCH